MDNPLSLDVNKKEVTADDNGNIYYKWPPFPDPPEGTSIISFTEFEPKGLAISFNDDAEVDGRGIPTVRLGVMHDNSEAPPKKKSKIKKTPAGEEIRRRNVWWEEWEEGEEQRIRSVQHYDKSLDVQSRIAQAVEDFKRLHDWEPATLRLKEWYQKLLNFLGQNEVTLRPRYRRPREEDPEEEEEEADDDVNKPAEPAPVKIETFDKGKHNLGGCSVDDEEAERFRAKLARMKEAQEIRLESFVDDPYTATRIFLSSYFRISGMMWERMALRDAPRIAEFFLKFLLKTGALHEEEAGLKKALDIATRAKEELPLTMEIGMKFPDELAQSLKAIYGSRVKQISWPDDLEQSNADAEFKAQVEEGGGIVASELVSGPESGAINSTAEVELPQAEETTAGWSSVGVDVSGWTSGGLTEETNKGDNDNPWAETNATSSTAWAEPEVHSLMKLAGPTTLPFTHTIGYVEESTRWISSITLPGENAQSPKDNGNGNGITSSDLFQSFARVVLKPYSTFAEPTAPRAAIQPPELVEDPWSRTSSTSAETPRIPRHDPEKDDITLLTDIKTAESLARGTRMGIGGTFVQVAPKQDVLVSADPNATQMTFNGVTFWYAEKIMQVIPSYWKEKQI